MNRGLIAGVLLLVLSACSVPESPASATPAEVCSIAEAGFLDTGLINEASGLAVSRQFPGRLYHVNDSGDSGRFFQTALDGSGTRPVSIDGFDPVDAEDLAFGPCGTVDGDCLFVADIGDNNRRRSEIRIVVVRELEAFPDRVSALDTMSIRYPDGPHDAESLALHPNGDLFIITKFADYSRLEVSPSRIYRLGFESRRSAGDDVVTLERFGGDLELGAISSDTFSGSLPTGADISRDGTRLLVLTYVNAFEFNVDLARRPLGNVSDLVQGTDFQEISLTGEVQQEAVAYFDQDGFLYTTERASGNEAPILEVRCEPRPSDR